MSTTINPTGPVQTQRETDEINLSPKPYHSPVLRQPKKRSRRGLVWNLTFAALVLAAAGWGVNKWYFADGADSTEIVATAKRATLDITVTERGDLESSKTSDVRCEVEGRQNKIVSIVAEGTQVKKDQVVLTFDADEFQRNYQDQEVKWKQAEGKAKAAKGALEVEKNKAATDIDKAALTLVLADLEVEKYIDGDFKVELEERKSDIELAKKELQEATDQLEQYRKLVRKGFGTNEVLRGKDNANLGKKFNLASKEAKLWVLEKYAKKQKVTELKAKARDAKRDLDRAKNTGEASVDKAQSELDAANIATRLEKTTLDRLKKQLDACQVKAPSDGILVYSKERYWDDSARIQAGATVYYRQGLFSLPDLTKMQMKMKVHESLVKKVAKGLKAEIRLESYPNKVLHGTVEKVGTLASSEGWFDRFVKEYETILKIEDLPLDAGLKPGMTGEVKIFVNQLPDVLLVPVQAVGQKQTQHYCYVAKGKNIERREIVVGENNDKYVEIKSGLEEGEKVLLDARARIAAETKANENTMEELPKGVTLPPVSPAPVSTPPAAVPAPGKT